MCAFDFQAAAAMMPPPQALPPQALPPQQPLYDAPQQPQPSQQPPPYGQPNQWTAPWQATPAPWPPAPPPAPPAEEPAADQTAEVSAPAEEQATDQPAPQTLAAPTVCLRCYAPLHPGYTQCGNCGFDNATAWGITPAQAPSRIPLLPIALALLGIGLLIAAAALVLVAQRPRSSAVEPTQTPVAQPTTTFSAFGATPTPASTVEPAPIAGWTHFTSPDGAWSTSFPSVVKPEKMTQPVNSGGLSADMNIFYVVDDTAAAYAVIYFDFPSTDLAGVDGDSLLTVVETKMLGGSDYTLVNSITTSEGAFSARDMTVTSGQDVINLRMWLAGNRFYMLMTDSAAGLDVYPQHFYSAFSLQ
jgi:ribosomal protein L40E